MLAELTIRDFAIIDELQLPIAPGFNVLTGETGAGKSIILDAVTLVLGGRADMTMIRSGCDQAYVEAVFTLEPAAQDVLNPLLDEEGLLDGEEGTIILAREVRQNGRSIGRVNGRAVNLGLLKEIGEYLVDIHGQGEHLSLLRPRSHLPLLDAYGGLDAEREAVGREVAQLQAIRRELSQLQRDERALAQRMDLLQFQVGEIDAARLEVNEEEALRAERTRLANVEQLMLHTAEAMALLLGADDDAPSATDLLGQAERAMTLLARLDSSQEALVERLQGLSYQLSEVAADIRAYQDDLETNPERLAYVEERIELINRLKRKYGPDIAAILELREKAAAELDSLSHSEERIAELLAVEERYLQRIGVLAEALSAERQEVAGRLAAAVVRELAELRMEGARFEVAFGRRPETAGVPVNGAGPDGVGEGGSRYAFDQTGIDQVEFLISTNPGEPVKSLAKVASGGETARLMLALKTALAEVDSTPTLIFDEIDQGIGGRVGAIVGRKLWGLTLGGRHQVIVVTHLPQLAGFGDRHFHVSKRAAGGRTITEVDVLEGDGRVRELAAMLGTAGQAAREGAMAILSQAEAVKAAV